MKHNLKKPCAECPFKKKCVPGYLGPHEPEPFARQAIAESGVACHMHVDNLHACMDDIIARGDHGISTAAEAEALLEEEAEQCAGAILYASKSGKTFRPGPLADHQALLGRDDETVMDYHEFLAHHMKSKRKA